MDATGRTGAAARRRARLARRRLARRARRLVLVLVVALVVGSGTFVGGLLAAPIDLAVPPPPKNALLLAADGTQLATLRPQQQREIVPADEIPLRMVQAIISAEDERFLEHRGVDPLAIVRAAYRDLTGGRTQGGSTLTQQYVKNVYVGNKKTYLRKVREAALAVRLEQRKAKEEILTDYLNVLYLGNSTYGVQAASRYYFGVPVKDLDLDEGRGVRSDSLAVARAAMLAGIAPAPSVWNPVRDMATAKLRQRYVLNRMVSNGYITSAFATEALRRGVKPVEESPPEPPSSAPEFTDLVKSRLRAEFDTAEEEDGLLFRGGLRVRTTLDNDLQTAVAQAVREVLPDDTDPQAAVVAVDIRNGDVKAMSTLRRLPERYLERRGASTLERKATLGYSRDGLNLATNAFRSVGSTIKPFTLAAALEKGRDLDDRVFAPGCDTIPDPGATPPTYRYCNASGEGSASRTTTLAAALARSVNTVYVPLAIEAGRPRIAEMLCAAGARTRVKECGDVKTRPLSFGLGTTVEASPLSMATAYATLLNGGRAITPRLVREVRAGGEGTDLGRLVETDLSRIPDVRQVVSGDVAADVVDAMSRVATRSGTAPAAAQPTTVYGKTGTTNDSTNAWFIGCLKAPQNLCMAVWMGYEETTCRIPVKDGTLVVRNGQCGGMKGVQGVKQVFGGTLPAKVFARSFEILREIKAARAAAANGEEPVVRPSGPRTAGPSSPAPSRSAVPAGPSATPTPRRTGPQVVQTVLPTARPSAPQPRPTTTSQPPPEPSPTPSPS